MCIWAATTSAIQKSFVFPSMLSTYGLLFPFPFSFNNYTGISTKLLFAWHITTNSVWSLLTHRQIHLFLVNEWMDGWSEIPENSISVIDLNVYYRVEIMRIYHRFRIKKILFVRDHKNLFIYNVNTMNIEWCQRDLYFFFGNSLTTRESKIFIFWTFQL